MISKAQPITFDRQVAEAAADNAVLGTHTVQKTAKIAQKGDYLKARLLNAQANKLMSKVAGSGTDNDKYYRNWSEKGAAFENALYSGLYTQLSVIFVCVC